MYGDTGIAWHRDASYAHARAVLVDLGPCTFELDRARGSANGSPADPVSPQLLGGEVLDFDCKRQHRVIDADPSRWSVVLWRFKRQPRRPSPPRGSPEPGNARG